MMMMKWLWLFMRCSDFRGNKSAEEALQAVGHAQIGRSEHPRAARHISVQGQSGASSSRQHLR